MLSQREGACQAQDFWCTGQEKRERTSTGAVTEERYMSGVCDVFSGESVAWGVPAVTRTALRMLWSPLGCPMPRISPAQGYNSPPLLPVVPFPGLIER